MKKPIEVVPPGNELDFLHGPTCMTRACQNSDTKRIGCTCLVRLVKNLSGSLEELLRFAVQSNEYNDEQCPEEIKDLVRRARKVLGLPR